MKWKIEIEGTDNKPDQLEEWVSEGTHSAVEFIQPEDQTQKRIVKEWRQLKGLVTHHQTDKCMYYRGLRSRKERGAESIFKEIMAENVQIWRKKLTSRSLKPREYQTKWIQRDPH